VSIAQSALARGLAALSALGADATEEQTAEALMQASQEIRTLAEQECSGGGSALQLLTPAADARLDGGGGIDGGADDEQRATTSVLRLFSQLEESDSELSTIRAQARTLAQMRMPSHPARMQRTRRVATHRGAVRSLLRCRTCRHALQRRSLRCWRTSRAS
jgi:hypothetical protein